MTLLIDASGLDNEFINVKQQLKEAQSTIIKHNNRIENLERQIEILLQLVSTDGNNDVNEKEVRRMPSAGLAFRLDVDQWNTPNKADASSILKATQSDNSAKEERNVSTSQPSENPLTNAAIASMTEASATTSQMTSSTFATSTFNGHRDDTLVAPKLADSDPLQKQDQPPVAATGASLETQRNSAAISFDKIVGRSSMVSKIGSVADHPIMEESEDQVKLERSDESLVQATGAAEPTSPRVSAGNFRPLPREIGFDDASSRASDPSIYTVLHVESMDLRDAFNIKGVYTGFVDHISNLPHGKGTMRYHSGRSYEGDWILGHWHGKGKIRNKDGDVYLGSVVHDLKEGDGKIMYPDGRVLIGKFKDDHPLEGAMKYPDGSTYEGQFHRGSRRGRGKYNFADGSYYEGEFEDNNFHGEGLMRWPDGGWYSGSWVNGKINGHGKEILPDGTVRHEGQWKNGAPVRT